MEKLRYLQHVIAHDLAEKMVFVGGPRQVGKTTLAKHIGEHELSPFQYLNWDRKEDRKALLDERFDALARLLVFDEIHKYRHWKNYLKGVYDDKKRSLSVLVSGSARLDLYRRGGDSLQGRYHYFRLHPFSLAELEDAGRIKKVPDVLQPLVFSSVSGSRQSDMESLLQYGGFPEPLLKQDGTTLRRWQNERVDRLVREDIRDIENVRDLSALQVLVELMPSKVSSLFSLNALREDLHVAHKTVASWVDILDRFYYLFRVYPYASTAVKSLRKEPKVYLWDWSEITERGAKLENMVASHLLKFVHYLHDAEGHKAELYYLRDAMGREVDFLVAVGRKPWFAVEVKEADSQPSKQLSYFSSRIKIPFSYQVVGTPGIHVRQDDVEIVSVDIFLRGLGV